MQPLRAFLFGVVCFLAAGAAHAEITLSPLRQVITEKAPVATYRISNPSRRIVNGRLSWVDLTATETGYKDATPDVREKTSAAPYLAVEPASFRLKPGENVAVTVTLRRKPPGRGEWRSHLLIETDAARTALHKTSTLEVDIGLGISTPVILRAGNGVAAAKFADTQLVRNADGLLELETYVEPQGDFSPYGGVEAYFSAEGEKPVLMRKVDNVAAYVDAKKRRVIVPLGVKSLPRGVLEIRYAGRAEFDGRVFAERSFTVGPPAP